MNTLIPLMAMTRTEQGLLNLLLALGVAVFAGGFAVLMILLEVRRQGRRMNGALWWKVILTGIIGLAGGFYIMNSMILNNPRLFGYSFFATNRHHPPAGGVAGASPAMPPEPRAETVPQPPNHESRRDRPEIERQAAAGREQAERAARQSREERERRAQAMHEEQQRRADEAREEHERRARQMREEHERRVAEMRAEQEERRAAAEAARAAEQAAQEKDKQYLASLGLGELEKLRTERQAELDRAKEAMRAPAAGNDERTARSQAFSRAVKAYQAVVFAISEKRRAAPRP